jgi:hypothetical protein
MISSAQICMIIYTLRALSGRQAFLARQRLALVNRSLADPVGDSLG